MTDFYAFLKIKFYFFLRLHFLSSFKLWLIIRNTKHLKFTSHYFSIISSVFLSTFKKLLRFPGFFGNQRNYINSISSNLYFPHATYLSFNRHKQQNSSELFFFHVLEKFLYRNFMLLENLLQILLVFVYDYYTFSFFFFTQDQSLVSD